MLNQTEISYDEFTEYSSQTNDINETCNWIESSLIPKNSEESSLTNDQKTHQTSSENNNSISPMSIIKKKKKFRKTKVELTNEGLIFRNAIYKLIKGKIKSKFVEKKCLFLYHNLAKQNNQNITEITREEMRSVNKYYNNHAKESSFILLEFEKMQNLGIINYEVDYFKYK